jgi:hypothetical protein
LALDIFAQKLGDLTRPVLAVNADNEALGRTADALLSCVQTVVDVMSDPKNGAGYRVTFAQGSSAYTSHKERLIAISAAPLLTAKVGTPLADIAAIMTGFTVHEVGHTHHHITEAVRKEWPGKDVPSRLGNIIEDMVLEAATIERYAGFRDVFRPTLVWVADKTCPKFPIPWGTKTGQRVNFIGQVLRYREFVTFAQDEASQRELGWFIQWGERITSKTTPAQAIALVREALARIHDHTGEEPEPEKDEQPPTTCTQPGGGKPEDDDDETEPGEGKGEGKGTDAGMPEDESEDEGEGGKGESESEDDESEGEGEGEGEPDDGEGEPKGDGKGDDKGDPTKGTSQTADTSDEGRIEADAGVNDTDGAGGSGQAISETLGGDPDADLDRNDLDKTFDDIAKGDGTYEDNVVDKAIATEHQTVRLDAKEHGKMRVIFHG